MLSSSVLGKNVERVKFRLVLAIGFRTLIVPGLTPLHDDDSLLGFNIAFCEDLFESSSTNTEIDHSHDGHTHSHGILDSDDGETATVSLSNHCTVAFMGGIFIGVPSFDINKYIVKSNNIVIASYIFPTLLTPRYQFQPSRAPPNSQLT